MKGKINNFHQTAPAGEADPPTDTHEEGCLVQSAGQEWTMVVPPYKTTPYSLSTARETLRPGQTHGFHKKHPLFNSSSTIEE